MNILLVNPSDRGEVSPRLPPAVYGARGLVPPLGLAYLGAVLRRAGHTVSMLDLRVARAPMTALRSHMGRTRPDLVGVSAMTPIFHNALHAAKVAKGAGATVVMGGSHVSAFPRETLLHGCVDYAILGEGEEAMVELAGRLEGGGDPSSVEGIVLRRGGRVVVGPASIVADLDSLPFPACDLLPMRVYGNALEPAETIYTLVTSRGCPHRCRFCFKQPQDGRVRYRSAGGVADEIEYAKAEFHATEIMFYDDNVTLSRAHILGVCEEILRRGIRVRWEGASRMENVDRDLLRLMKRSGCVRLRYGVESGCERTLRRMGKEISLRRVEEVFRATREAGIKPFAYFIIAYLGETEEDIRATADFARALGAESVMFNLAVPYPGTPLFEEAAAQGLVDRRYWVDYALGGKRRDLPALAAGGEKWIAKAYRRFYLRPGVLLKHGGRLMTPQGVRTALGALTGLLRW